MTTMTIAAMVVLMAPNIISVAFAWGSTAWRFNQGFDDGCNDGKMAPGSHTKAYIDGFNEGLMRCDRSGNAHP